MKVQKVIMITGAGKGFGLEMVRAALLNGDKVIATVRTEPDKLKNVFNQHPDLLVLKMDVTIENTVRAAVKEGFACYKRIDAVINNAGYGLLTAVEEASDEEVKRQYDTNVFGVLNVIRAVLPVMRGQRSGHIINISSLFGHDSIPGWTVYGSTKFAIEGLSKGLAKELLPFGIHVIALAPGLFSTDFLGKGSYAESKIRIDDYAGTVGLVRAHITGFNGNQPGDPAKLAKLAIRIAHEEQPPLHLLAGQDAVEMYRENARRTEEEVSRWMADSLSTGHESKPADK